MPPWLQIALGVLASVLALGGAIHAMLERQTRLILLEQGKTLAEHIAECPARSRAVVDEDDSGQVESRDWSPSTKLRHR